MKHIPLFNLENETDLGLTVKHMLSGADWHEIANFPIHRNEEYLFILNESGTGSMSVDFETVILSGGQLGFVAPGQVHHSINAGNAQCWLVSVYPYIIDKEYLAILEDLRTTSQKSIKLTESQQHDMRMSLQMLESAICSDRLSWGYRRLIYALLNVFLCQTASAFEQYSEYSQSGMSRPRQISQEFQKMLEKHFLTEKSPAFYASQLNITVPYLNECIKEVSGRNSSETIQQRIILEARRLLAYSSRTVKEIAHELGYFDHKYFSRLFKKITNITPVEFRQSYRGQR